jgi:K+-transporting ATPase ATPase B chain
MTTRSGGIFTKAIVFQAIRDSVVKLDPRTLVRNPVIFIVELGSVITTVIFFRDLFSSDDSEPLWFTGTIALWLWLTVLFANFAEAVAEGRGKAQANALRATRTTTMAFRRTDAGGLEEVAAPDLQRGDVVVVEAGQVIPADGEIIEGVGSVDESAITGESAPVIREAGGDRSAVTGGTRLLSDRLVIEVTQEPGRSFLDRMIALVEGAERRKTPNEIALNILLAGLTITFVVATVTLAPFADYAGTSLSQTVLIALLVALIPTTAWTGWCSATCSRCPAARSRPRATSTSCCSTRRGRLRSATARRRSSCRSPASTLSSWPRSRSSRRSPTRRPRAAPSSCSRRSSSACGSVSSANSTSSCPSLPRLA